MLVFEHQVLAHDGRVAGVRVNRRRTALLQRRSRISHSSERKSYLPVLASVTFMRSGAKILGVPTQMPPVAR